MGPVRTYQTRHSNAKSSNLQGNLQGSLRGSSRQDTAPRPLKLEMACAAMRREVI